MLRTIDQHISSNKKNIESGLSALSLLLQVGRRKSRGFIFSQPFGLYLRTIRWTVRIVETLALHQSSFQAIPKHDGVHLPHEFEHNFKPVFFDLLPGHLDRNVVVLAQRVDFEPMSAVITLFHSNMVRVRFPQTKAAATRLGIATMRHQFRQTRDALCDLESFFRRQVAMREPLPLYVIPKRNQRDLNTVRILHPEGLCPHLLPRPRRWKSAL